MYPRSYLDTSGNPNQGRGFYTILTALPSLLCVRRERRRVPGRTTSSVAPLTIAPADVCVDVTPAAAGDAGAVTAACGRHFSDTMPPTGTRPEPLAASC